MMPFYQYFYAHKINKKIINLDRNNTILIE